MPRQTTAAILLLAALAAVSQVEAATVFQPYEHGLRVKVDSFVTEAFPLVEAVVTLDAPRKMDFRYLNEDHVGVIEEEVPVRDLKVSPFAPPLSIALVLDDSGSMERNLVSLRESVDRFIDEMAERDEAAVIGFNRGVQVLQPMTYSKPALREALGTLKAYGATALFDGVLEGLRQLSRSSSKKTMIVVSDGVDQVYPGGRPLSRFNAGRLVKLARKAGVEIYTISLGKRLDPAPLEMLASGTGGFYWHAPDPRHLKPLFDIMARSFHCRFKLSWESPNSSFDRKDRTVVVDVCMGAFRGRGVGTYWLDHKAPSKTLQVKRKSAGDPGLSRLRLFTWGVDRLPLELEFFLYDEKGRLARHGFTTKDGFGRLERSGSPQLTDILPGRYRLVLRREGSELDFEHPDVILEPSRTLTMSLGFSQLVFRRDGKTWFNLRHDYGDTDELIEVEIEDLTSGKKIYDGRLVDFSGSRERAVWLQEGAYKVRLKNKWPIRPGQARQAAVLKNSLEAEFHVDGGSRLFFDTRRSDFLLPEDVLSRDYLISRADESPFKAPTPVTRRQVATLARQQARRYRKGTFDRFREHERDSDALYPYMGAASLDGRVAELSRERIAPSLARRRANLRRRREREFMVPFHNERLNSLFRDIHDREMPSPAVPPAWAHGLRSRSSLGGSRSGHPPAEVPGPPRRGNAYDGSAPVAEGTGAGDRFGPVNGVPSRNDYLAVGRNAIPRIDPSTPSRAEELRLRARSILAGARKGYDRSPSARKAGRAAPGATGADAGWNRPSGAGQGGGYTSQDANARDARLDDLLDSVRRQMGP